MTTLNPGSDEALAAGCRCPVLDNAHGKGYLCNAGVFVYSSRCPLHWPADEIIKENDIRPPAGDQ